MRKYTKCLFEALENWMIQRQFQEFNRCEMQLLFSLSLFYLELKEKMMPSFYLDLQRMYICWRYDARGYKGLLHP